MTTALVRYGATDASVRASIVWAKRRDGWLPLPLKAYKGRPKPVACPSGHKYREGEYYVGTKGERVCKACAAIRRGRKRWKRHVSQRLIAAHPDHGGSRTAIDKVLKLYRTAAA